MAVAISNSANRDCFASLAMTCAVISKAQFLITIRMRLGVCWLMLCCFVFSAQAYNTPTETTVFTSNTEGYYCYRIPTVVRTNDGTLLAFAEGRVDDSGDYGDIDIVLKRSTDGGSTWGSLIVVDTNGTDRVHNPTPVVDRNTGRIYCFFGVNGNIIAYKYSTDNGASWSSYTEIPSSSYPTDVNQTNGSIHTGPCHGIQLLRGANAGRLVIPYRYITSGGFRKIRLLYSDNGGTSWLHSQRIMGTTPYGGINEVSIEELTNGNIYFNMRNQTAENFTQYYRIVCQTSDFLETAPTLSFDTELPDPICHASVLKTAATDQGDAYNQILFANPSAQTTRRYMKVRSSLDESDSWTKKKLLTTRYSGYSDMTDAGNNRVGILYETGDIVYYATIVYCFFDESWVTELEVAAWEFQEEEVGQYATSTDTIYNSICYGLHGVVTGSIQYVTGTGGSDKALEFTSGDYITIVDSASNDNLDFAAGETFSIETAIKTTSHNSGGSSGSGAIVAKDGSPPSKPRASWWLRVQDGYAVFKISDGTNEPSVTSSVKVNDGAWHTIEAVRDVAADQLQIYIDGTLRGTATDTTAGSLTTSHPKTLRSRMTIQPS